MLLLFYFSTPSILFILLSGSSLAGGLVASVIFAALLAFSASPQRIWYNTPQILFLGLSLMSCGSSLVLYGGQNLHKQLPSIILFAALFPLCNAFFSHLTRSTDNIRIEIKYCFYILATLCLLSYSNLITPGRYTLLNKPIFPFGEPSHFALAFFPIALSFAYLVERRTRLLVFGFLIFTSLSLPSTTMLAGSIIYLFSTLIRKMSGFVLSILAMGFILISINPQHFSDRLQLTSDSENLSALIYLQGMLAAEEGISANGGLGIGFQLLGSEPENAATDVIYMLTGKAFNRQDGGFLGAKIIGEFGLIGIIITALFLYTFFHSVAKLRQFSLHRHPKSIDPVAIFIHSVRAAFILEILIRGYGYFSPGFLLFMSTFTQNIVPLEIHHRNNVNAE